MSDRPYDDPDKSSDRVVKHNEKFNVPMQTEKEEAESQEHASVEHLANNSGIQRKKKA